MKKIALVTLLIPLAFTLISTSSVAQWLDEIQISSSEYDDLNPVAYRMFDYYTPEIWIFWERHLADEIQIFYRGLDAEGNFISDEMQLTSGPGSNYNPRIGGHFYPRDLFVLTWERENQGNKDILFSIYADGIWSEFYEVFNSVDDEYSPWVDICADVASPSVPKILISAQKRQSVLYRLYNYSNSYISEIQSDEIIHQNDVTSPSCAIWYSDYVPANHVIFALFYQEDLGVGDYRTHFYGEDLIYGWSTHEVVPINDVVPFDPWMESYAYSWNITYFSYVQNDTVRLGQASFNHNNFTWVISLDLLENFEGDILDPASGANEASEFYFVSDNGGQSDIFHSTGWSNAYLLIQSPSEDRNPHAFEIINMVNPLTRQLWVVWETNRDGNWNVYTLPSEVMGMSVPDEGLQSGFPEEFSVSIYPNPGNAEFKITLDNPVGGEVKANIYDISGRLVTELHHGWLNLGSKSLYWNVSGIPSGIYLLQVQSYQTIHTEKIVLLK